ncbi:hypothetical protein [Persephonella sp.]|uniref:hypothetical protein n=1 Tax=Persephonella sp. TaxID=2060922 RepID=UPI002637884E|nr:hypothetical protein [Persephonella sp.]
MENKAIKGCLEDLIVKTFLYCKERCIRENGDAIIISLSDEDFMNSMLKVLKENITYAVDEGSFVDKIANILSTEKNRELKGKVIKDLDGVVLYFE